MSMRDELEKALTLFKKRGTTVTKKPTGIISHFTDSSFANRTRVVKPKPPPIIDRVFEVRPWAYGDITPAIRDQIELPRMCASRRMPWMARYILVNGRWVVTESSRADWQTQHELYGGRVHDSLQFSSADTGYEVCAWCNTTGKGAIRCLNSGCGAFTCHGTIYQRGFETWGRCVCGQESRLIANHSFQTGIFPKVRAR